MATVRCTEAVLHYEQSGCGPDIVWLAAGDQPGHIWRKYQTSAFDQDFRNTTYDARGVGRTRPLTSPPWTIEAHARDCADLIEARCEPPVLLVGLSMGACIVQELCIQRPELVRCAVAMGACARKRGFIREWENAEIAFRRQGGQLTKELAIAHYAILMYPAEALGDREVWERVRPIIAEDFGTRDGDMLAAQWEACLEYDSLERLKDCDVPLHVIGLSEDVQTPPSHGEEVAAAAPAGRFHLLEGLGHGSAFGHRPEVVNSCIRDIFEGSKG